MNTHPYFYRKITSKSISIFGNLFRNIYVARPGIGGGEGGGGSISGETFERVPISFAPREKFLERITKQPTSTEDERIAVRFPRMSFFVSSFAYNDTLALNKTNTFRKPQQSSSSSSSSDGVAFQSVPYILTFELAIAARGLDDIFQIIEQIIPFYSPDYTVTANNFEREGATTDIPITLTSVDISDDFEGDFESRRMTIATLSFEMKVRYGTNYRPTSVIRIVNANIRTPTAQSEYEATVTEASTNKEDMTVVEEDWVDDE